MLSPRARRNAIGLALLMVVVLVTVGVYLYIQYRRTHIQTDDAFVDATIYYVSPRIAGRVVELLVEDNQYVQAEELLVRLDPGDIEASLRIAEASLAQVQNQVTAELASIEVAQAQIRQLEPQLDVARREAERMRTLFSQGGATRQQLDEAQARVSTLRAQLAAAKNQVTQIQAGIGPKQAGGKVAAVSAAEARIAQLALDLSHTRIRAPHAGYVTRRSIAHGAYVQPAQLLMALVPLDEVYVTANYKETELTDVRAGQHVRIHVDTYPDEHFAGRVHSIMAGTGAAFSLIPPQNATGNYIKVVQRIPVRIALLPREGQPVLRVGMSVVPTILIEGR